VVSTVSTRSAGTSSNSPGEGPGRSVAGDAACTAAQGSSHPRTRRRGGPPSFSAQGLRQGEQVLRLDADQAAVRACRCRRR
jgi:hypothetical protein